MMLFSLFIFGVAQSFVSLLINHTPHILDVGGDVVTEILLQLTLGSSACVAWCRVLWTDVVSSSSYFLNPGQHFLLQALNGGLHVESETMWVDEWRHNISIASDHPNTIMLIGCLFFINISTSCGDRVSQWLFYELTTWSWQIFISS